MGRLILDTGVLVAAARGRLAFTAFADDEDDIAVPAVVVAEYLTGVLADPDPDRRSRQHAFLDELLGAVPVVDYDHAVARQHAALLDTLRRNGTPRGAHDLIIAAAARATGRTLVTTDAKASFEELPGVTAHLITP